MPTRRRPSGRESVLASVTLEDISTRARRDAGLQALAALAPCAPLAATLAWSEPRAIRLIDLERRARFGRPLAEFA